MSNERGFYVFQAELGAPLQFHPAVGTPELDDLLSSYLSGPSSASDKRAAISMDFFEFTRITGQSIKFYPVPSTASVGDSPASLADSGYASSYVSPIVPAWSWGKAASAAPSPSTSAKKPARSSRNEPADLTSLPGMKILTKDGIDVTNSASRGCKTREQRDHAHLMRIMKACESCRKKKTRCDPSHKRTGVAQTTPQSLPKPARRSHTPKESPPPQISLRGQEFALETSPLEQAYFADLIQPDLAIPWDDILLPECPQLSIPSDYDFFTDPEGYLTPSPVYAEFSNAASQPITPASPPGTQSDLEGRLASHSLTQSPALPSLPYLDSSAPAHNYVDFNLYSPTSSFGDEELFATDLSSYRQQKSQLDPGLLLRNSCGSASPAAFVHAPSEEPVPLDQWDLQTAPALSSLVTTLGTDGTVASPKEQPGFQSTLPHASASRGDLYIPCGSTQPAASPVTEDLADYSSSYAPRSSAATSVPSGLFSSGETTHAILPVDRGIALFDLSTGAAITTRGRIERLDVQADVQDDANNSSDVTSVQSTPNCRPVAQSSDPSTLIDSVGDCGVPDREIYAAEAQRPEYRRIPEPHATQDIYPSIVRDDQSVDRYDTEHTNAGTSPACRPNTHSLVQFSRTETTTVSSIDAVGSFFISMAMLLVAASIFDTFFRSCPMLPTPRANMGLANTIPPLAVGAFVYATSRSPRILFALTALFRSQKPLSSLVTQVRVSARLPNSTRGAKQWIGQLDSSETGSPSHIIACN